MININVSLPASQIKAPGTLLKDKKDPKEVKINTKLVHELFQSIGEKAKPREVFSLQATEQNLFSTEGLDIISPNETQYFENYNDETYMLISKVSKKIFSTYGIELLIDISEKYYELALEVLKLLVSDICSFHHCFFKKIKLDQLIISTRVNFKNSCSKKNVIILDELVHGKSKIHEAFYEIVFHYLTLNNPLVISEFKGTQQQEASSPKSFGNFMGRIEESFMACFMGLNDSGLLKSSIEKLQNILAKHYPEEIPTQWFSDRRKQRRKTLKVSFLL